MRVTSSTSRGDTIVEVMFAIAVFALLAVGCLAIMNRGIQTIMRSLEMTQVRQSMNDQAELLRYVQQDSLFQESHNMNDTGVWASIVSRTSTSLESTGSNQTACADSAAIASRRPFVLYLDRENNLQLDTTADKFTYGGRSNAPFPGLSIDTSGNLATTNGIWVEAVSPVASSNFVDFYIRACWDAPGSDVPTTLSTVVRLYKK